MKNFSYAVQSHDEEGNCKYFVFDIETGKTIKKNITRLEVARHLWLAERGIGDLEQ